MVAWNLAWVVILLHAMNILIMYVPFLIHSGFSEALVSNIIHSRITPSYYRPSCALAALDLIMFRLGVFHVNDFSLDFNTIDGFLRFVCTAFRYSDNITRNLFFIPVLLRELTMFRRPTNRLRFTVYDLNCNLWLYCLCSYLLRLLVQFTVCPEN